MSEFLASILSHASTKVPETPPADSKARSRADLWVDRILLVVQVVFLIELGLLLVVLPWTPIWLQNSLLSGYPAARDFLAHGFVRGAISGLGLINIWMAIWDAVHYRENP